MILLFLAFCFILSALLEVKCYFLVLRCLLVFVPCRAGLQAGSEPGARPAPVAPYRVLAVTAAARQFCFLSSCSTIDALFPIHFSLTFVNISSDSKSLNALFGFKSRSEVSHTNYSELAGFVNEAD